MYTKRAADSDTFDRHLSPKNLTLIRCSSDAMKRLQRANYELPSLSWMGKTNMVGPFIDTLGAQRRILCVDLESIAMAFMHSSTYLLYDKEQT